MTPSRRRYRMPDGIVLTVVPLPEGIVPVAVLRQAVDHAAFYLLWGQTYPRPADPYDLPDPTGPGGYLGCSAVLSRELRAGVSLKRWSTREQRLALEFAVLIDRPGRPLDPDLTFFIESRLLRGLFPDWTMLNSTSGCPASGARLTRGQVAYGLRLSEAILRVLRGRVLPRDHAAVPVGGPLRERLVRLLRAADRPMTTAEVVAAATRAGIPIHRHGTPTATVRRDLAGRERDSRGPTRVRVTHVTGPGGRRTCLFYPPGLSRADAVRAWTRRQHGSATRPPTRP